MSKATMDLHHNVKKQGSIIFTAIIAFFGVAVFPIGLVLILLLSYIDQNVLQLPDVVSKNFPVALVAVGLFAALYSVLSDVARNFEIHKKVIIELIGDNEAVKEYLNNGKNKR